MSDDDKVTLFFITVVACVLTFWALLPYITNIWTELTMLNGAYSWGLIVGIIVGVFWIFVIDQWHRAR